MTLFYSLVFTVQLLSAVLMTILILMQQGKGADAGSSFGSGGATSLFGASGGANVLSRTTALLATTFIATTLALTFLSAAAPEESRSVLQNSGEPLTTSPSPNSETK
jgi:preprotein translocase subunit SecG